MNTQYAYTSNLQVQRVARNDGSKEKYTYDEMDPVVRVDYYAQGQNDGAPSGNFCEYVYDEMS